jgi:glycosyltransferase involved in cell wall biosynthesis
VLFTTYPEAFLHKGGGEYELLEAAFNLRQTGLIADLYSPFSRDVEEYGVIVHFSLVATGLPFLEHVRAMGKSVVLWPNFWSCGTPSPEQRELAGRFFALSDVIVFKSRTEHEMLRPLIPERCRVLRVPAGVDPVFRSPTPRRLFRDSYGIEDYLLWVGIMEPGKKQLSAIRALRSLDMPLVFIGNYRDPRYYAQCREAAPGHFLFLPALPHKSDMLRAAMRECRLYIELSDEPAGKSVLEAVISGAVPLLAESDWAREHFGSFPEYVRPEDEQSVADGVARGLQRTPDPDFAAAVAGRHALPGVLQPLRDAVTEL